MIPESPVETWDDYTVLIADDAIIISDIEIPDHDPWMLRAALLTAMQYGIRKCIFAGDTIATDQEALNAWLKAYLKDELNYPKSIALVKTLLRVYKMWFTEGIFVISGNHDDRVARKTGGQVVLAMLLDSVGVDVSAYTYMYMFMPSVQEWVCRIRILPVSVTGSKKPYGR